MDKEEQLLLYSNPTRVHKLGIKILGKEFPIYISTRKDKWTSGWLAYHLLW